jgi:hypothetical protein
MPDYPIHLTYEMVRDELIKLAEERPDYVYEKVLIPGTNVPQCAYIARTKDGLKPSCLIGHVFHRLGVPLELLDNDDGAAFELITDLLNDGVVVFDDNRRSDVSHLCGLAQMNQDAGVPWGLSVSNALGDIAPPILDITPVVQ